MNILFLSTNDILGGAATVTLRLVEALRRQGVEARMLVGRKDTDLPYVRRVCSPVRMAAKVAERVQILRADGFRRKDMWKLSTASFGADPTGDPWIKEADAVVLGWVNQGLLSLRGVERLAAEGKPLLWWMHDYWCATGICHLPRSCTRFTQGCGLCPYLGPKAGASDLSARIFARKRQVYASARRPIRFLAVSTFQRSLIEKSALAPAMGPVEVLPHAFPAELYATSPTAHPFPELQGKKLIVCGAANLCDPMKNTLGAVEALNLLADSRPDLAGRCHALFFGAAPDTSFLTGLRITHTLPGPLDSDTLRELYASAAVVLSPSLSETMGATVMEGIAAGAVAASYDSGGPRDVIIPDENGFLAPLGDVNFLAAAIGDALDMEERQGSEGRLRRHASIASRFDAQAVARRLLSIIVGMLHGASAPTRRS